jgi:hypothetical protein
MVLVLILVPAARPATAQSTPDAAAYRFAALKARRETIMRQQHGEREAPSALAPAAATAERGVAALVGGAGEAAVLGGAVANAGADCHIDCGGVAGSCPAFCGVAGACCRQGFDADVARCGFGAEGCAGHHCCAAAAPIPEDATPATPSERHGQVSALKAWLREKIIREVAREDHPRAARRRGAEHFRPSRRHRQFCRQCRGPPPSSLLRWCSGKDS